MCWVRAGWSCVRVGGTFWNTLKGGGTENRVGETKILNSGVKLGQGVGTLKTRGLEPPYKLWSLTKRLWLLLSSLIIHCFGHSYSVVLVAIVSSDNIYSIVKTGFSISLFSENVLLLSSSFQVDLPKL